MFSEPTFRPHAEGESRTLSCQAGKGQEGIPETGSHPDFSTPEAKHLPQSPWNFSFSADSCLYHMSLLHCLYKLFNDREAEGSCQRRPVEGGGSETVYSGTWFGTLKGSL